MPQQTFNPPASQYIHSSGSGFKGWLFDESDPIDSALRDQPGRDCTLRSIYLYDDGEFLVNVTGQDLSDQFESNGACRVVVPGLPELVVQLAGADMDEAYHWTPENSAEVIALWDLLPASGGPSATLTLTDGVGEDPLEIPTVGLTAPDIYDFTSDLRVVETALQVTLTGGNYDRVEYLWSVTGGTLDDPTSAAPVWTRPPFEVYLQLEVSFYGDGFNAPYAPGADSEITGGTVKYLGPAPYGIRPSGEALLQIELEDGTALRYSRDGQQLYDSPDTFWPAGIESIAGFTQGLGSLVSPRYRPSTATVTVRGPAPDLTLVRGRPAILMTGLGLTTGDFETVIRGRIPTTGIVEERDRWSVEIQPGIPNQLVTVATEVTGSIPELVEHLLTTYDLPYNATSLTAWKGANSEDAAMQFSEEEPILDLLAELCVESNRDLSVDPAGDLRFVPRLDADPNGNMYKQEVTDATLVEGRFALQTDPDQIHANRLIVSWTDASGTAQTTTFDDMHSQAQFGVLDRMEKLRFLRTLDDVGLWANRRLLATGMPPKILTMDLSTDILKAGDPIFVTIEDKNIVRESYQVRRVQRQPLQGRSTVTAWFLGDIIASRSNPPNAPATPTLVSLTQRTINVSTDPSLVGSTPTLYRWRFSTDDTPSSDDAEDTSTFPTLEYTGSASTTYHIFVRAENANGNSAWSDGLEVTTSAAPPAKPSSISYQNASWFGAAGSANESLYSVELYCAAVSDATSYRFEIYDDRIKWVAQTHTTPGTASDPHEFCCWFGRSGISIRVRAQNANGNSYWRTGYITRS